MYWNEVMTVTTVTLEDLFELYHEIYWCYFKIGKTFFFFKMICLLIKCYLTRTHNKIYDILPPKDFILF